MRWSLALAKPIRVTSGAPLRTLGEARAYMLALPATV